VTESLNLNINLGQNYYKKKRTLLEIQQGSGFNFTGLPCNCTATLDRCAVCGGNGQSCVIVNETTTGAGLFPTALFAPSNVANAIPPQVQQSIGVIGVNPYNGGAPAGGAVPGAGGNGNTPSTQGANPTGQPSPSSAPPSAPGSPPVQQYNNTASNGGQLTVVIGPNQNKVYEVVAGTNVRDVQAYVTLLTQNSKAQVTVTITNGATYTGTPVICTYTVTPGTIANDGEVATAVFDYNLASKDPGCSSSLISSTPMSGTWYVTVTNTGSVPATVSVTAVLPPIVKGNQIGGIQSEAPSRIRGVGVVFLSLLFETFF